MATHGYSEGPVSLTNTDQGSRDDRVHTNIDGSQAWNSGNRQRSRAVFLVLFLSDKSPVWSSVIMMVNIKIYVT